MKNVRLYVRNDKMEWTEDYTVRNNVDAATYGKELIEFFNRTLRPGENVRTLIKAEDFMIVEENPVPTKKGPLWQ